MNRTKHKFDKDFETGQYLTGMASAYRTQQMPSKFNADLDTSENTSERTAGRKYV